MKEYKQLGAYGLIEKNNKILLIKKYGGPYNGKLDLPGGTIEFCEKPESTLKRELMEEALAHYFPDTPYDIIKDINGKDRMLFIYYHLN